MASKKPPEEFKLVAVSKREEQGNNHLIQNIGYSMESWRKGKVDLENARKVRAVVKNYFFYCADNGRIPSPVGMANWLGVSRKQMLEWRNGNFGSTPGEAVIQEALNYMEEVWYQDFMENKNLPTAYIFMAKNWFGYQDTQDITVQPKKPLGDEVSQKELERRIKADVVIDVEPSEMTEVKSKRGRKPKQKVEPNIEPNIEPEGVEPNE